MDVLQHLREATRSQHEAVEARVDLLRSDLTLSDYRRLLEQFYGFYAPLEVELLRGADWSRLGFSLVERRKAPRLEADLRYLGAAPAEIAALPRTSQLPDVTSLPGALGCLYVLEGATLGGQLIARHVIPLLGLAPDAGAAFFTSYGAEVGARWRSLGEFLRRQLGREADVQRAAGAACDTFGKLDCWLARGQEPYDGA